MEARVSSVPDSQAMRGRSTTTWQVGTQPHMGSCPRVRVCTCTHSHTHAQSLTTSFIRYNAHVRTNLEPSFHSSWLAARGGEGVLLPQHHASEAFVEVLWPWAVPCPSPGPAHQEQGTGCLWCVGSIGPKDHPPFDPFPPHSRLCLKTPLWSQNHSCLNSFLLVHHKATFP